MPWDDPIQRKSAVKESGVQANQQVYRYNEVGELTHASFLGKQETFTYNQQGSMQSKGSVSSIVFLMNLQV